MNVILVYSLLLTTFSATYAAKYCNGGMCEEVEGIRLLEDYNAGAEPICRKGRLALWKFLSDMNEENQIKISEIQEEITNFTTEFVNEASQCNWNSYSDPLIRRQFKILTSGFSKPLDPEENKQKESIHFEMQKIFGTAAVCPYETNETREDVCTMTLDNGIQAVLETSTDPQELKYYWIAWRNVTGKKIRDWYIKYISLINKEAVNNGFTDRGEQWRSVYEVKNLREQCEQIMDELRDLFGHLFVYVRRKLINVYGKDEICTDGPIPAHLLGMMMGETWANLENLTRPYPNKPSIDITSVMQERNLTVEDMVKISENFFESMGLPPMTEEFWNGSIFERIPDRDMNCHPSSLDLCKKGDYRIQMCGRVTMNDLKTIHHEMGHIQYFMAYENQPPLFREGANEGFHEAIGDAIALSVFTPTHWKALGFMENVPDDEEQSINALYQTALDKIPVIAHTYVVDRFRWDLFDGTISTDDMNTKWWEYRLKYQGNCPPVRRTEEDFDPASLYHVAADIPYIRYFTSVLYQFQFFKILCNTSGHTGPLHTCDIYNSKKAGESLKTMMSLGTSKPWTRVLEIMSNGEMKELSAAPLIEYFKPLLEWLKKENKDEFIGWNSDDPTICP